MSLVRVLIALLLLTCAAHAQKVIGDYAAATAMARTDKLLLQQGSATTPYTYGTPALLFSTLNSSDVTTALGYTPLASTGTNPLTIAGPLTLSGTGTGLTVTNNATVSGSLNVVGTTTMSGGVAVANLPTSCTNQPTGILWNNGNVLSVCP